MMLPRWLRRKQRQGPNVGIPQAGTGAPPLREFIYLDEVSLRSLLSSQKGGVIDTTSEQSVAADQAELGGALGVNAPMLAKAEITSRYQTSNSSTLQTSRKATVQSWFREFHNLTNLRILEPQANVEPVHDVSDICALENPSISIKTDKLRRGELVEFRVRLTADPVFRFGTLMTEFSDMVDETPVFFAADNTFAVLSQMNPVNRILQRLLAGLIPIRAEALDYVVINLNDAEYVVHRDALAKVEIETYPLEIVGVTEHLAYWKDIRRVLFSEAEFTMLCRVARNGLQSTWTPVKLAELFLPFAPDLVEQLNVASRSSVHGSGGISVNTNELLLGEALRAYMTEVLREMGKELGEDQQYSVEEEIRALLTRAGSVSGQRSAFLALRNFLSKVTDMQIDATVDLNLRESARTSTGLPLFPALSQGMTTIVGGVPAPPMEESKLLDVEVVAIYW